MLKKYRKAVLRPCMCALIFLFSLVIIIFSCERLEIKRITKVSTGSVSGITASSSIVQGNVIEQGEGGIKQHGHCWSETSNPTIIIHKTDLGARNTAGTFNSTLIELSPNTQYFVRAYATDNEGTTYGNEISFVTMAIPIPEAPGNLAADAESSSKITISWTDNSNNEEGFKIERSPDGSTNWVEIATVEANMTNFSNMGLSPSTQYCYRVRAFNAGGNSEPSGTACTTTKSDVTVPSAPTNLAADAESSSQITINWTDNSDNETGFEIERSPDGSTGWVEITDVGEGITMFTDIGLTPSTAYYYRVRAYNGKYTSDYSNTANATTLSGVTIPADPSSLIAEAVSYSQINLSWTDNADNEYGFKIERSLDGVNWEEIAIVGADITTFQNRDLSPSTPYCYRVRAYNAEGNSDYSNTACTTTLIYVPLPVSPANLIADAISDSRIDLSWVDNSDNEEGFHIERSEEGINWIVIATVGTDVTIFQNIELPPSTLFYYRVRAFNPGGDSEPSNTAYAETSLCPNTIIIDHIAGDVAPVTETNFRYGVVETSLSGENKCWIKQNLGAHHVAGGPTDDTEESAGWYWQFNRKQGYQHDGSTRTPGTTWIYPIDEASDWTADNDPCTILFGRGWRIPTQMEWQNVDNNGGWNNYNDAYASDLNLHGSGVLVFHDGSLYYRGLGGAYWSSTQYDGVNSYWLNIDNSNSRIEASYKSAGHSVRCIRD